VQTNPSSVISPNVYGNCLTNLSKGSEGGVKHRLGGCLPLATCLARFAAQVLYICAVNTLGRLGWRLTSNRQPRLLATVLSVNNHPETQRAAQRFEK